jgi:hypothetical protein
MVRCTSLSPPPPLFSVRALPMESTSSMKMMDGACSLQYETANEMCSSNHQPLAVPWQCLQTFALAQQSAQRHWTLALQHAPARALHYPCSTFKTSHDITLHAPQPGSVNASRSQRYTPSAYFRLPQSMCEVSSAPDVSSPGHHEQLAHHA